MKHNYLDNTPLNKAREDFIDLLNKNGFSYVTENIPVTESLGRITARAHYAKICSPHYNASAMDGIAVKHEHTLTAGERNPVILTKDKYVPVDTGDPLPENTDSVIMIEDVIFDDDGSAKIYAGSRPFMNVRQIGEDICMGDMLIPSFTKITPVLSGALLAGGNLTAEVIKKPVFGIIPTGDEIVAPKENPGKGEIIEFNSTVFSGMLKDFGAESTVYPIVPDKKELLRDALKKALAECDGVLILAGSSAGRDDYTKDIISEAGKVLTHGIAIKPGKPAVLGCSGKIPVIGLPGYPVSAIVIMNEIVRPLIESYFMQNESIKAVKARLARRVVSSLKYEEFIRVTLGRVNGEFVAVPVSGGAGVITSFTKASGILRVKQDLEGIEAGEEVDIELLCDEDKIGNSLIVTGSHDPVIDEISDIMMHSGKRLSIVSSHVGSMGAVTAIKSGAAHMGAIHLLDENTGEYNESYVKRYFPDGGVILHKGLKRIQGLMVRKGNPLGIKDFSDITKGIYVNRQGGSGTRVLCDYLLKKHGIEKSDVKGYFNEEFTHTAVAAAIKNGNADMGLGILSAAKMYELDFIPVGEEEYDFLISEDAYEGAGVQEFLRILGSEEFLRRIEEMGGYGI